MMMRDLILRHWDAGTLPYHRIPGPVLVIVCIIISIINVSTSAITINTQHSECLYTHYGTAYDGNISVTRSGKTCQAWSSQNPHVHPHTNISKFPDQNLTDASNHCRNPSGVRDRGVWCYTTDPDTEWEYCNVPYCECKILRTGHGYLGTNSRTYTGLPCQRWDSQSPHAHTYRAQQFDDFTLADANNYCRNPVPSWHWGTFCLTSSPSIRQQHCSISFCECKTTVAGDKYEGYLSVTISGKPCQAWSSQQPHEHSFTDISMFPDTRMAAAGSHCRNPDDDHTDGPWCFTTDPETRWEPCDIPMCEYMKPEPFTTLGTTPSTTIGTTASITVDTTANTTVDRTVNTTVGTTTSTTVKPSTTTYIAPTISERFVEENLTQPIQECKFSHRGSSYRGSVSVTASGRACQDWTSQVPHAHLAVPADSLPEPVANTSNKCRNPTLSPQGPWCFTTSADTRYEFCDIPLCNCKTSRSGSSYQGYVTKTRSGMTCQLWASQTPHRHEYTDSSFTLDGSKTAAENYCRNPDNDNPDGPWCYTTDAVIRWSYCAVPFCECKEDVVGSRYQGTISVTVAGNRCQRWDSQSPHNHNKNDPSTFPEGGVASAHNYCRNPDLWAHGPWCYTTDAEKRWELCDIPLCELDPEDIADLRGPSQDDEQGHESKEDQTTSPKEHRTTTSKEERTTTPKEGHTTTPKAEQSTTPKEERTTTPKEERTTTPKEEQLTTPKEEKLTTPKEERTTTSKDLKKKTTENHRSSKEDHKVTPTEDNTTTLKYDGTTLKEDYTTTSKGDRTTTPLVHSEGGDENKAKHDNMEHLNCKLSQSGETYQGSIAHTETYLACQSWSVQTPHQHPYTNISSFPDHSLQDANNYCRNPDRSRHRPWCYTLHPHIEWQYCPVPDCGCKNNKGGWTYNGTKSVTKEGYICQRWDSQSPHKHLYHQVAEYFPDVNLTDAANYCRNPQLWEPEGPWCYTTNPDVLWDYCDIPFCECKSTVAGHEYGGKIARSKSGLACQRWDTQSPHQHPSYDGCQFPDGTVKAASDYCRNPDVTETVAPFCYTRDLHVTWEHCDIPLCHDAGQHPLVTEHGVAAALTEAGKLLVSLPSPSRNNMSSVIVLSIFLVCTIVILFFFILYHLFISPGREQPSETKTFDNPLYDETQVSTSFHNTATSVKLEVPDHQGSVHELTTYTS